MVALDYSSHICGCCDAVGSCPCSITEGREEDPIDERDTETFRWCSYHKRCAAENIPVRHAALVHLGRAAVALRQSAWQAHRAGYRVYSEDWARLTRRVVDLARCIELILEAAAIRRTEA